MASDDGFSVSEKPRRMAPSGKMQTVPPSISSKEILSIMSGKFNEEIVPRGGAVKKRMVNEPPAAIPTHKMGKQKSRTLS